MKKDVNPEWKTFTISVRDLCNGDYDRYEFVHDKSIRGMSSLSLGVHYDSV